MPHTATWKATERRVAAIVGGKRLGCGVDRADVRAGDWLVAEVKHRQSIPAWLKDAIGQARRYATAGQLPVAILHEAGARMTDALVVMTLADFQAWHGKVHHDAD